MSWPTAVGTDCVERSVTTPPQPAGPPKESVDLSDEEHAWWAARDELETGRVPHGRKRRSTTNEPTKSGFETYYSSESLFDWTGDEAGMIDETDPYVVLGLPTSATWDEITSAHRRLAKLHHPDRLVDATPEERESSDRPHPRAQHRVHGATPPQGQVARSEQGTRRGRRFVPLCVSDASTASRSTSSFIASVAVPLHPPERHVAP